MIKILTVLGTRPEAIKLAPLILDMEADPDFHCEVASTGQHASMLDVVLDTFQILPEHSLGIHRPGQTLEEIWSKTLQGVAKILVTNRYDAVVVQGDTSAAVAAGIAAFHAKTPLVHLEAGLRTGNVYSPFPEEMNRRILGQIAQLHLAPTTAARSNLLVEGVASELIAVTGNTVIDAITRIAQGPSSSGIVLEPGQRLVLVTTHRRESWGQPILDVANAVAKLADARPDVTFFVAMHPNPLVRNAWEEVAKGRPNLLASDSVGYSQMAGLLRDAHVVLTDSGGLQEEAPAMNRPVLVLRNDTERMEGVHAGNARLIGTDPARVWAETLRLLDDPYLYASMAAAGNPYGDGKAATRCLSAIRNMLHGGGRMPDFEGA